MTKETTEEDYMECRDRMRLFPAPNGFIYVIARRLAGGVFCADVVLLMPEDV